MADYSKVNAILKKYDSTSKSAMESAIATLPKTKFWWRGVFSSQALRGVTLVGISCLITSIAYYGLVFVPTHEKYERMKVEQYDWKAYQDFERKRAMGMFRSCPPDGQERKYSW